MKLTPVDENQPQESQKLLDKLKEESMDTVVSYLQHIPAFSFVLLGLYGASLKSFVSFSEKSGLLTQHELVLKTLLIAPILTLFGALVFPLLAGLPRLFEPDHYAIVEQYKRNILRKHRAARLGVGFMILSFVLIACVLVLLIINL